MILFGGESPPRVAFGLPPGGGPGASGRLAHPAGSRGLSTPAFRVAGSEPEDGRGPEAKGAAWPSEARTCPRTAGAAEGWGAPFLDSAESLGAEQAVRSGQDAMWPEGAVPDCGSGRPRYPASQAKWEGARLRSPPVPGRREGGRNLEETDLPLTPTPHPESP